MSSPVVSAKTSKASNPPPHGEVSARTAHVCVSVHERGGAEVVGRGRSQVLKIKRRLLSRSPSPAVFLVDDHVHFPGSVFCDPPMRHQQADTCRDGGMQELINTHTHTTHTHLLGCQVSLQRVTAGEVTAPVQGDGGRSHSACESMLPALSLPLTCTHTFIERVCVCLKTHTAYSTI